MSTVTLQNVSLQYPNGFMGLSDINLRVTDGEFIALIGPSGSGKTTLLRTIAGFLNPSIGEISIGEQIVSGAGGSVPPEQRGLGMVFQQHAIWTHLSVAKNVEYPLKRQRIRRQERAKRVAAALQMVGLAGYEDRNPATLSGGQRQRVALARAVITRPQVLLLDEALSALDEPLRDTLRLELRRLTRELGLTVIHVTHDRREALALADRVAVLENGKIQQLAPPAALLNQPATAFVAGFVADANILDAVVSTNQVTAVALPLNLSHTKVQFVGAKPKPNSSVVIAIHPEDVIVEPSPAGPATVVSALYSRDSSGTDRKDAVLDWNGVRLRCLITGECTERDRVTVRIRQAFCYPQTDGQSGLGRVDASSRAVSVSSETVSTSSSQSVAAISGALV
ncbi:ABC transporter ATP-binding protein [Leucobacter sp. OH1287]|uniref:ABC transporter ATP-binding protein n=1 Tax=Leucobacter sp. OH1287 TaxID=2491049 RepID=UPI000F5FEE6D|nr:ABC transporter ATP-binding protein [Leucobacter sp. OH1287]RRD60378.1 ABC transporter ATP-binding protein [Leucobacter sp. OH1287]